MGRKKIVCLGGGSYYFGETLSDLAVREGLKGSEIVLYDIDLERAELMAKCGRRLSEEAGADFKIYATKSLPEAVDGADFVIANIGGVGGGGGGYYSSPVHVNDLHICAKYGVYQIIGDTCGPAAMMGAFRTIPVYMDICLEMERRCPNAIFINHANPMAILCRAIIKYSGIKNVIGICHGVQSGIRYIAKILEIPPEELETIWIGTNHYYWFIKIYHRGKDLYPELKKRISLQKAESNKILSTKLSQIYGYQITYPHDSHIIEFYPFLSHVREVSDLSPELDKEYKERSQRKPGSREAVMKDFKEFLDKVTLPQERESLASLESLGKLIEAIALGKRHIHIVNIPNQGAVSNLPVTAILEVEGVTNSFGVRPVYMGEAPLVLKGHLERIIAWQELVVDAGVKGDRNIALQALMLDPQAIPPEKAEKMFEELLVNSKEFLPQFK